MVSFVASFLVSFFDLLISKCKLKSIATFLASSKADKNLNISYLFLCSGIFLGISTLRHSTYLWASSFLMLRFQRSFAVPSLHWSCGCPSGENPRYHVIIYSSWSNIFTHSLEVAKVFKLVSSDLVRMLIILSFLWSSWVLICCSSLTPQIQQTIPLSADVKWHINLLDAGHVW